MLLRSSILAITLALTSVASHAAPVEDHAQSVTEIRRVVESFRMAIIQHDGKSLKELFLPDQGNWLSVLHDDLYQKVHAKHPEALPIQHSSYAEFADFVSNAKTPIEETFHDVRVETNGTIGIVYFDFEFLDDAKVENRGAETWQLIKTDKGWKIAAMLYSSRGA